MSVASFHLIDSDQLETLITAAKPIHEKQEVRFMYFWKREVTESAFPLTGFLQKYASSTTLDGDATALHELASRYKTEHAVEVLKNGHPEHTKRLKEALNQLAIDQVFDASHAHAALHNLTTHPVSGLSEAEAKAFEFLKAGLASVSEGKIAYLHVDEN